MVAWSIARLVATSPALVRTEMRGEGVHRTPADILLTVLASPCDLDVLLFVHRHPRALLGLDDLARGAGYSVREVRASIEALTAAGLVACAKRTSEDHTSSTVFYEFTPGTWDAIVPTLLWVASSADGRRVLRRALSHTRHRGGAVATKLQQ
jgi:hypothetical protein